ncbi:TPA: gamma-glutamylcysteine synthetase, partial [Streptococcus suis]
MTEITNFFKEQYISKIKNEPELFIGVELEYPIVNKRGKKSSIMVAKELFKYLSRLEGFDVVQFDGENNPIELIHSSGDVILFEVTYNTIEFAFAKAYSIFDVESRFLEYLKLVQDYLGKFEHELQGIGINPHWKHNDHRPVEIGRYKMLMNYLKLSNMYEGMHKYTDYAGFICGNQVQFDVSQSNFLDVINAFNKIEAVKAFLFANSKFEMLADQTISRDYFWEKSMHGLLEDNVGIYPSDFQSLSDFINYKKESAIFYAVRNSNYYYFRPIALKDYLNEMEIVAYSEKGEMIKLLPQLDDLNTHRSYHYQELTRRGTVEFRSICAQPFDRTFTPTAFHLGLLTNLKEFENILEKTDFFINFGRNYKNLRKMFSKQYLSEFEFLQIQKFAEELFNCAYSGLEKRKFGEEKFLEPL